MSRHRAPPPPPSPLSTDHPRMKPELTLRPSFKQNQKRWDFSQAETRISTPSHHQPPADNYSTPNYKNTKIKTFCFSSHWILTEGSPYQNWKKIHILPSRETIRRKMIWCFDLLPARPLRYSHLGSHKTLQSLYQFPVVKPCSHFTSLIHCNIILSLDSIPLDSMPNPLIHLW